MKDKKKDIKVFTIIGICILILLGIAYYQFDTKDKAYYVKYDIGDVKDNYNKIVNHITEGLEVGQSFVSKEDKLAKIYIHFDKMNANTNSNEIGGNSIIGLKDEQGNIIIEKQLPYNYIRTNSIYKFEFPVQENSKDKQYYLYIKYLELGEKAEKYFSIYCSDTDVYKDGSMYINNVKQDGDIYFQELYYNPGVQLIFIIITVVLLLIFGMLIVAIHQDEKITPERIFSYVVPTIFIAFLLFMPTLKNHDEIFHWFRIYDIAQGHLFTEMREGEPKSIAPLEISEIKIHDNPANLRYKDLQEQFSYKITTESRKIISTLSTTAIYNPVQYLPQALGVFIADKISDTPMVMAYAARIFNMIITAVILYMALKCMPFGKNILLLLMCIPIAVEGFSSMSPDAMTISVVFLFIAYVLKLFSQKDKKITRKDKIYLFIMSIVIALCKIVYIPVVGLLLILPKDKFKTRKEQFWTVGLIIGLALTANLIWLAISNMYLVTFRGGNSKYQIANLLSNPIEYMQMLFNTINLYGKEYLYSMFGGELGWDEYVKINSIVPIAFGGMYLLFSTSEEDIKNRFTTYQKVIMVLIILAIVGLIFTSLYVQWTPLTYDYIAGVQGRYFIPILPLISLAILSAIKVKNSYKEESKLKFLGISILVLYIYVFLTIAMYNL